jgi:hypothetical protein
MTSAADREVRMLRAALLGGPLGEPFGRDYDKLPEYAQEQIDGYVEAIQEAHPPPPSVAEEIVSYLRELADACDLKGDDKRLEVALASRAIRESADAIEQRWRGR